MFDDHTIGEAHDGKIAMKDIESKTNSLDAVLALLALLARRPRVVLTIYQAVGQTV
jgi:hypothetical protein